MRACPELTLERLVKNDCSTIGALAFCDARKRLLRPCRLAFTNRWWITGYPERIFPWGTALRYLLRDRDRIFGAEFVTQVKAMGIQQVLSAQRSPRQRAMSSG